MGAFFLYRKNSSLLVGDAEKIFSRKGFYFQERFELGDWALLVYPKQLISTPNYHIDEDGSSVFCCGTVVYRGLEYRDSLRRLLTDFHDKKIDQDELIGNFCLLFWDGRRLSVLTDRLNIQHVFVNEQRSCLSSSFLSVLAASPHPLPLNQIGLCEKLSAGYITSPDTLVDGIVKLDEEVASRFTEEQDHLVFITHPSRPELCLHNRGREDSLSQQIALLERHFSQIDALYREFSGELGLSTGYDSRLILACAKFLSYPLSLHTHATEGMHNVESTNVSQIAKDKGLELTKVATRLMIDQPEKEMDRILRDGLYYFDGRCSRNMGAFHETYTREYKIRVLGPHRLSLNGMGGEVYRNYYFTWRHKVNLRDWMEYHVYYPYAKEAIGRRDLYEEMHTLKVRKMSKRLSEDILGRRVSFLLLRRYYSEIQMPDSDANNNNAHNQVALFHTPFFDPLIVYEGINATPYIGYDGVYQAELIRRIDPKLTRYPSHYGHSFDSVPWKYKVEYWLRENIPERLLLTRARLLNRRQVSVLTNRYMSLVASYNTLSNIREVLCDSILKGPFENALQFSSQRRTTIFVGSFLLEFHHKLKW